MYSEYNRRGNRDSQTCLSFSFSGNALILLPWALPVLLFALIESAHAPQFFGVLVDVVTKPARVVELHPDGRLECEVETEAPEPDKQFVAFEAAYLDQLVRKFAALRL